MKTVNRSTEPNVVAGLRVLYGVLYAEVTRHTSRVGHNEHVKSSATASQALLGVVGRHSRPRMHVHPLFSTLSSPAQPARPSHTRHSGNAAHAERGPTYCMCVRRAPSRANMHVMYRQNAAHGHRNPDRAWEEPSCSSTGPVEIEAWMQRPCA